MKIGFFDTDIQSLLFFKEMVKAFPDNDFYYYGDTEIGAYVGKTEEEMETFVHAAVTYFNEKGVLCICVPSSSTAEVFVRQIKDDQLSIHVVTFDGFESYAIESTLGQSTTLEHIRSVHLTQHSPKTNERIATLLGGHFIEE